MDDVERAGHWETCALGTIADIQGITEIGEFGNVTNEEIGDYFGETILQLGKNFTHAIEDDDSEEARRIYTQLETYVKECKEKTKEGGN